MFSKRKPLRNRIRIAPVIVAAVWVWSCWPGSDLGDDSEYPSPVRTREIDTGGACPDWRWIGVMEDSTGDDRETSYPRESRTCPRFEAADPRWQVRPLFADATPALAPYCLYEHSDRGEDLLALPLPDGLEAIDRDCMTVFPVASEMSRQVLAAPLEQRFLHQAGRRQAGKLPVGGAPVRLAVVDNAPTEADDPRRVRANSPHGIGLIHMADHLLCGGEGDPCVADLTTRLALAYVTYSPWTNLLSVRDEVHGGYVGLLGDLAQALRDEVIDWGGSGDLVLNLSIAWHPMLDDVDAAATDLRPPVRAVHDALVDAVCRGAAVVAAAGNSDWGPSPGDGPLLPAAWERRAVPSALDCAAALGPGAVVGIVDGGGYRPLVHAVGGVEADGSPLLDARFGARPRLVAFGDHAVIDDVWPHQPTAVAAGSSAALEPTMILTGSSVSALVVSATAAAVWHGESSLAPPAVMQRLYDHGEELAVLAEHCLGGTAARPCPRSDLRARRVYLDPAVAQGPPFRSARGDTKLSRGRLQRAVEGPASRAAVVDLGTLTASLTAPECEQQPDALGDPGLGGAERLHYDGSVSAASNPCPHWQFPSVSAEAWVNPQPESKPCPPCTGGSFYIEIGSHFAARELSHPTLKVNGDTYALPIALDARRTTRAILEGVDIEPGDDVLLSFVVDGDRSAICPVLVDWTEEN